MKSSKSTIMFYINSIHDGGAERVILQLAHRFSIAGYRSILVTSFVDGKFEYPVPEGVERISMETKEIAQSRLRRNFGRILKLRQYCKKYKPVALISFMAEPNFRAICATIGLPVKSIVSVRNDPEREYNGKIGRLIGRYLLPLADGCVFQTEDAKVWFPQRLQKKSAVIMNEVAKVFFDTQYIGGRNIVTLGRLTEQKNQTLLIRAFSEIAEKYPSSNLEIYGDGPLRNTLEKQIKDLKMTNRIILMGATKNAASVLATAKLFVLSSNFEGMPNALMEALTIGVPSISTDCPCGGPKVLIDDGVNGLLISVDNKDELIHAMERLLSDEKSALMMGENAKKSSMRYHPDTIFDGWKRYIEHVISN